jgi:hypothetical protein
MFSISSGRPGPVHGGVADTSFVAALGGDYAARLHLVRLPAFALTTPRLLRCQHQTPLRPVAIGALNAQVTLQRLGGLPVPRTGIPHRAGAGPGAGRVTEGNGDAVGAGSHGARRDVGYRRVVWHLRGDRAGWAGHQEAR